MSMANDTSYLPDKLPFSSFDFQKNETAIAFRVGKKRFECSIQVYTCAVGDTTYDTGPYVLSPDSAWEVFSEGYNLYLRPRGGGKDSVRLTTDGEEYFAYGIGMPQPQTLLRNPHPHQRPSVVWSPDSKKIVVTRTDERHVLHMHYISYTSTRPRHFEKPYALPGDSIVAVPSLHLLDLTQTLAALKADGAAVPPPANMRVELQPAPFRLGMNTSVRGFAVELEFRQDLRHHVHARREEAAAHGDRRAHRRAAHSRG